MRWTMYNIIFTLSFQSYSDVCARLEPIIMVSNLVTLYMELL